MSAHKLRTHLKEKGLTNREAETAELVTLGLSNKEIANQLFITEKTVKHNLVQIYDKLDERSRVKLIVYCLPFLETNDAK